MGRRWLIAVLTAARNRGAQVFQLCARTSLSSLFEFYDSVTRHQYILLFYVHSVSAQKVTRYFYDTRAGIRFINSLFHTLDGGYKWTDG